MSAQERSNIIRRVEETQRGKRKILTQLQVPKSNYYRWRARALQGKQDSSTSSTRIPWNKLSPPEVAAVLAAARSRCMVFCSEMSTTRDKMASGWPCGSSKGTLVIRWSLRLPSRRMRELS